MTDNCNACSNGVILSLKHIVKTYPGVIALNNVSLDIFRGEVHALVGENGAGKSTLINVISGATIPDSGSFIINGESFQKITPHHAREKSVEIIYQEINLVPAVSVAENIFMGNFLGNSLTINFKEMEKRTAELFETMSINIDPKTIVGNLPVAQMQLVEIAKALLKDVKILVMDEPTAPLTMRECDILFKLIHSLRERGVTIIYISHRLSEIYEVSDRLSVLRDGEIVATKKTQDTARAELIRLMVGRELTETYPQRTHILGETVLEVKNLTGQGVKDISFSLKKGEILGLAGLVGSGRTEVARMIFGADKKESGKTLINGKEIDVTSPERAVGESIGLLPEDRKMHGVLLGLSIRDNITLPILKRISKDLIINRTAEKKIVNEYKDTLHIKSPSLSQLVMYLSGGNQQKVIVSKWLASGCQILIFDEPTRGIDVGSKHEIYLLMNELTVKGISIIMISSEMEEILGMSDRIIVLHEGTIAGLIEDKDQFTQEHVLKLASGTY
jgi:ribose transport system ATP-binding protein